MSSNFVICPGLYWVEIRIIWEKCKPILRRCEPSDRANLMQTWKPVTAHYSFMVH